MLDSLGVLQHLLSPQLEEVPGICVELEAVTSIVPVRVELVERWWPLAHSVRLQHGCGHGAPREDLLVKLRGALERLAHLYIVDSHCKKIYLYS